MMLTMYHLLTPKHSCLCVTDQRKSHVLKLVGALGMLILLGVPWVFSAFGVIESSKKELEVLEGAFQVSLKIA